MVNLRQSKTPRPDLSDVQKVSLNGEVMEPSGVIIRALYDPGIFVQRGDNYDEPLYRWQARAVEEALRLADYKITEAFPPANAGERKEYIAVGREDERRRIVAELRAQAAARDSEGASIPVNWDEAANFVAGPEVRP